MIIIFILMPLALFGSAQSVSFECRYMVESWAAIGNIYFCLVQNAVNITSLNASQVDSITGTHKVGYNNDNVEAFQVVLKGQIHYFPRGLNKFFKNLKAIEIVNTGLKEVHQSDLKDFPKLMNLNFAVNNLEILEQNLFEFNPILEWILLFNNKIQHIDPNVFDKLTKLNNLHLDSNTCINMATSNNSTELQNLIIAAKAQCINSDYKNLEQKIKNLEIESKTLNYENLKLKLENLENEIKNSKFPNFFQERLQALRALLIEMEATTTLELESKVNDFAESMKSLIGFVLNQLSINKAIELINKNNEEQNKRFTNLMQALENAFSTVPGA